MHACSSIELNAVQLIYDNFAAMHGFMHACMHDVYMCSQFPVCPASSTTMHSLTSLMFTTHSRFTDFTDVHTKFTGHSRFTEIHGRSRVIHGLFTVHGNSRAFTGNSRLIHGPRGFTGSRVHCSCMHSDTFPRGPSMISGLRSDIVLNLLIMHGDASLEGRRIYKTSMHRSIHCMHACTAFRSILACTASDVYITSVALHACMHACM
jgi:hypothetical protein